MFSYRKDRRPAPPGHFITVDGIRLHCESWGDGPPDLVLFHGYLSSSAAWHKALPILAHGLRAVAVDLPGAGYSERPDGPTYDIKWMAGLVPAIISELGMSRPYIGGHSLGGAVALTAAARDPAIASGLVMVSPLAYQQRPPPGLRLAKKYPGLMGAFFSSPIGRLIIGPLVNKSAYDGDDVRETLRAHRLLNHLDAPGGWEAATKMGLAAGDSAPRAEEVKAANLPTLVFWGKHDKVYTMDQGKRLEEDLQGPTSVVVMERSGHYAHEEEWERFAKETLLWVKSQSA